MPEDPKPEGAPVPESAPKPEAAAAPPAPPAAAPPAPKPAAPAAAKPAAPAAPKAPPVMMTEAWSSDLTEDLAEEFGGAISEFLKYQGQPFLVARPDAVLSILQAMKDNHDFDYLVDITAVHWPARDEQFDVIYIVYSFSRNERVRIKIKIQQGYKPLSATLLYPTADWLEREVYDMFGIEFEDHPNMKRILLPDEWSTFPLLKENGILKMDQQWVQENLGIESGQ